MGMWRWVMGLLALAVLGTLGFWYGPRLLRRVETPIRVGILHSLSGPLEISERSMIDAEKMAIDEINSRGGLLGRRIEAVIADGRSDPKVFAQEARRLIETEKVSVIFGGWSSRSRRAMKPVVETSNHLLFFPSNYEGMDISPNIVCTGPIPNQQVMPAVNWCHETLKANKFFLAGTKGVQSYSTNEIIKLQLRAMGLENVGEKYLALNGDGAEDLVASIKAAAPDVVLSTVVGDGNKQFFLQMARAGLPPSKLPVLAFTIAEDELRGLPLKDMVGDYAAWSYFQTIDSPENQAFVRRFKSLYGADRTLSDSLAAAYSAVRIWAQSVEETGTDDTAEVRKTIRRESLEAAEGVVSIDSETLHTWRPLHVGKIQADGLFQLVWRLEKPIRPVPFPVFRTRSEWSDFIEKLHAIREDGTSSPVVGHPLGAAPAPPARSFVSAPATTSSGSRRSGSLQR
jgi:urea transport system substrate-binding protein